MMVSDLQPHSRFRAPTFPLFEVASNSWVCVKGEVCHLFQLVPLRGFGGFQPPPKKNNRFSQNLQQMKKNRNRERRRL